MEDLLWSQRNLKTGWSASIWKFFQRSFWTRVVLRFLRTMSKRLVKTALHQAVMDCRIQQVRLLVLRHEADVNVRDVCGNTALMLACRLESEINGYKMAKLFIEAGACISTKDFMNRTALSLACMKGRTRIVKLLLQDFDHLDINCPDKEGRTPVAHAALCGKPEIVKLLVDIMVRYDLPVDTRDCLGYTPLLLACKHGNFAAAHYILTDGKASASLCDEEYFLNARQWVLKSSASRRITVNALVSPLDSFSRESTSIYRDSARCRSIPNLSARNRPATCSGRRLSHNPHAASEHEARTLLLNAIEKATTKRPSARATRRSLTSPRPEVLTAKGYSTMAPNLRALFELYAEQCHLGKFR